MKIIAYCIVMCLLVLNLACSQHRLREGVVAGQTPQAVKRQILVTLNNTTEQQLADDAATLARTYKLRQIAAWPIAVLDIHCFIYEIESQQSAQSIMVTLRNDPRVESVQLMNLFEVKSYNDPYLKLQNNVQHTPIEKIHRWTTGKGIRVAIIDSGVAIQHPDLQQQIISSKSFVDRDTSTRPTEIGDIHGTAIAGVIAARPNNRIGIVGVAPDAELLALKACWATNVNSGEALCNSFTLARALSVAIQQEAHIINLSLTGPRDPLLKRIIQAALKRSICVVAADADTPHTPRFPAELPGVIAVRSLSQNSDSYHSQQKNNQLSAPGKDILTTVPKDSYDFMSGSSLAAASVSGVVALLLQQKPDLNPEQVQQLLISTARPSVNNQLDTNMPEESSVDICAAVTKNAQKNLCP